MTSRRFVKMYLYSGAHMVNEESLFSNLKRTKEEKFRVAKGAGFITNQMATLMVPWHKKF